MVQNGFNLAHTQKTYEIIRFQRCHLPNMELNEMSNQDHKIMRNISQSFKFNINIKFVNLTNQYI